VAEQTFTVVALTGTLGPPVTSTNAVLQFTSINTDIAVSVTSSAPGKGTIYYKVSDSTFGTTDIPNGTTMAVTPNGWVPTVSGKPFYVAPNQYVGVGVHTNAVGVVNLTMNSLGGAGAAITLSLSPWTHTTS
jgi:hypothetical protein